MANPSQPMAGKICLITGATSGIGKVSATEIAQQGATTILVGRNPELGKKVQEELKRVTGNSAVDLFIADLSLQADVRKLAQAFHEKYNRLDVLLNNAGAVFDKRRETPEGIEMTFALNHLNYFLLTHLLLDTLKASAPSRIINVSSAAHMRGRINFTDLEGERKYNGWVSYAQSKLANILFTYELSRRLAGTQVTANTLHPGFIVSNFGMENGRISVFLIRLLQMLFAINVQEGAQTSVYLATSPEVAQTTGQYFVKKRPQASASASLDVEKAKRLWEISAKMTGIAA